MATTDTNKNDQITAIFINNRNPLGAALGAYQGANPPDEVSLNTSI